jgi:tol-pal system protein YbgF
MSSSPALPLALASIVSMCGCAAQRGLSPAEELLPPIDIVQLHDDVAESLAAVRELRAEVAQLNERLALLEQGPQSGAGPAPDRRHSGGESLRTPRAAADRPPPQTPPPDKPAEKPVVAVSEGELYLRALDAFGARDYEGACRLLGRMVSDYPGGEHRENGSYWMGESLFGLGRYDEAVEAYKSVLRPPASPKDDDAQMKLGVCYVKMGKKREARQTFEKLIRGYPDSEYVRRAESYLEKLGP